MRLTRFGHIGFLMSCGAIVSGFMIGLFVYFTFVAVNPTLLPIIVESEHFRVHSANRPQAVSVAILAENALSRIKSDILINTPDITSKIDVFIWETQDDFRKIISDTDISDAGVSQLFTADDGSIIRRIDIVALSTIATVLPHEIAHLLLGELDITRRRHGQPSMPLALHEGIAILAEGRCNDELLMKAGMNMDCAARSTCDDITGHIVHWDKLLSEDDYKLLVDSCDFYAESYSLAEYLMKELKPEGIARLLQYLENGKTIDNAIQLAMGDTSENFKANLINKWHAHAKSNTNALIAMR